MSSMKDAMIEMAALFSGSFLRDEDGGGWRKVIEVDLMAAQWGVRMAARTMMASSTAGVILVTASAGAVFPIPEAAVYAAGMQIHSSCVWTFAASCDSWNWEESCIMTCIAEVLKLMQVSINYWMKNSG